MWVLSVVTLINRSGTMVLPFLVLYLTQELHFSAPRAGFVLAIYGAGSIIVAPLAGRLSDRLGPMPVMRASLVLSGILLLIFPFFRTFVPVLIVTFVWAVVTDLFRPANLAVIADIVHPEKLKPAYALSRLAINVGMSIGPAAAGFIAAYSYFWIFMVDGVTTLAAATVLLFTRFDSPHRHVPEEKDSPSLISSLALDDRRMVLFMLGILLTAHWPHRRGLASGALLFAIGSGAWGVSHGPLAVTAAMVVWTFGEMLLFPQAAAYVAEIAPPARRGAYMGAYSLAFSVAFSFAPWLGTSTYSHFGARFLWVGVFVVGVVSALIMMSVRTGDYNYTRANSSS